MKFVLYKSKQTAITVVTQTRLVSIYQEYLVGIDYLERLYSLDYGKILIPLITDRDDVRVELFLRIVLTAIRPSHDRTVTHISLYKLA